MVAVVVIVAVVVVVVVILVVVVVASSGSSNCDISGSSGSGRHMESKHFRTWRRFITESHDDNSNG